jgi:FkbM family methyltransferase
MLLLLRTLNKLGILPMFNLTVRKKINGVMLSIPLLGRMGLGYFYEREIWMTVILQKLLPVVSDKTFVDVGVNIGQTLLIVKSNSPAMDYVGFEPNPHCNHYIARLIEVNQLHSMKVVPCALGDYDGIATLFKDHNDHDDSSATIVKDFRKTSGKDELLVPIISFRSLALFQHKTVGIIKIDVEGGEVEVLGAVEQVIARDSPFIICEILPAYSADNHFRLQRQKTVEDLLMRNGYVLFRIRADGTLISITSIGVHSKVEDSNYLFVPSQKLNLLSWI